MKWMHNCSNLCVSASLRSGTFCSTCWSVHLSIFLCTFGKNNYFFVVTKDKLLKFCIYIQQWKRLHPCLKFTCKTIICCMVSKRFVHKYYAHLSNQMFFFFGASPGNRERALKRKYTTCNTKQCDFLPQSTRMINLFNL